MVPCPVCGTLLDTTPPGARAPRPRDFTVCMACAAPLQFTARLRLLRASDEDIRALPLYVRAALRHRVEAIAFALLGRGELVARRDPL